LNDRYIKSNSQALVITAPGVLGNDADVDSASMSAILVSGPTHGSLILNSNGSFTYMPAVGYSGSDSFIYKANDGFLDSNPATVNLEEKAVADFSASLTNGSAPLVVSFTNHTTPLDPANTYLWDFGDGTTSTEVNPSHTYTAFGTYTVSLSVNGPKGEDIEIKVDYIKIRHLIFIPMLLKTP
jgi:PKD repeat protein